MNPRIIASIPFVSIPFSSLHPMRHSTELSDYEFEPLQPTTVALSPAAVDWAAQICQQVPPEQQWMTFLRALALGGVQQWLEDGVSGLTLTYDPAQPPGLHVQGTVHGFRLCIVPQGTLSDGQVPIPQPTLEDVQGFAHLYLLVEVREEVDQVTILGGLRRDRLLTQRDALTLNDNGTYTVPVAFFDTAPEEILLYLNCLDPAQLETVGQLPQAASPTQEMTQEAINVWRWLGDRLDTLSNTVTSTLTWALLPPLAMSPALRSSHGPAETLATVLRQLEPAGVMIPATARGAYTDLQRAGVPLRLCALTWTHLEGSQPEWCLLLVLGPTLGEQILPGTRLVVRDAEKILADSTLSPISGANHLYAQVFGTWEEAFRVSVTLPDGSTLSWPPFVFHPEA
ncbi:hypothetical protein O77CONTIG1_04681 [Leptolyngbya sp. O-77]|nr:hypothetical protein O77CONTIG1_04681 [Leptolyngbya sp. O-77]